MTSNIVPIFVPKKRRMQVRVKKTQLKVDKAQLGEKWVYIFFSCDKMVFSVGSGNEINLQL